MCGRYVRNISREMAIKYFDLVEGRDYFDIHGYKASREVFPGEWIFAIDKENRPEDIWWTIVDKDNGGIVRRAINARAESVSRVPMFRDAYLHDRVLIPATGFFEWDSAKRRHLFTLDEEIFAFGGIARDCEIKGGTKRCGVILTTEANDVVRPIHAKGRMPVIIHKRDHQRWLDPGTSSYELRRLIGPVLSEETHVSLAESDASEIDEADEPIARRRKPDDESTLFDL